MDGASFVDDNGVNHRVIHSGVKYAEADRSQPPSIILANSIHTDVVIPSDYIYWSSGLRGSWETKLLIRTLKGWILGDSYYPSYGEKIDDIVKALKMYEGRMFRVLLPFVINDKLTEYIFTFKILKTGIIGKNFKSQISSQEWFVLDYFLWVAPYKTNCQEIILKWGKPSFEDEDSIIYKTWQSDDFGGLKLLKFIFNDAGIVSQIRVQK